MFNFKLVASVAVASAISACATTQPAAPGPAAAAPAPKAAVSKRVVKTAPRRRLAMKTGVYQCELRRSIHVKSVSADQSLAVLNWKKKDYTMRVVHAPSGALRLEHASGLTWITVANKSMLLDTKRGKQLANECRV